MTDTPTPAPIKYIARRCANKGLRLRQARALFDALHIADALGQTGGNVTKAAKIAGVTRTSLLRMTRGKETEV